MITIGALLISASAFAGNGILDGKSYCRTIVSDGSFGQPAGERQHCVSFDSGVAMDNANTSFGNPPEYSAYSVKGRIVSFGTSKYVLSKDLSDLVTISGSAVEGTVLTLQK